MGTNAQKKRVSGCVIHKQNLFAGFRLGRAKPGLLPITSGAAEKKCKQNRPGKFVYEAIKKPSETMCVYQRFKQLMLVGSEQKAQTFYTCSISISARRRTKEVFRKGKDTTGRHTSTVDYCST